MALSLPPRGMQDPGKVSRGKSTEAGKRVSSRESPETRREPTAASSGTARKEPEAADPENPSRERSGDSASATEPSARSGESGREYEERRDPFTQAVEQVDLAVVQSLAACGVKPDRLSHAALDFREHRGKQYRFQEVELRVGPNEWRRILEELKELLDEWEPDAALESVPGTPRTWRIRLNDRVVTHRIALRGRKDGHKPDGEGNGPRIALVMDDMGNSLERADKLLRLTQGEIALSVLPHSPYSEEIARKADSRGADVLLHLPMEPKGYPETDPGPGALFVNMEPERIRSLLRRNLQKVPALVGVNNHMGSLFTTAELPMRQVLTTLRRRDLFYMDSLTSPDSVVDHLAPVVGVDTISRDIFLDNEKDVASIRYQLRKAEHLARKSGKAVVTGHPYPQTIEALRKWLADKDEDIRLCRLSRLVRAENDQAERREAHDGTDTGNY